MARQQNQRPNYGAVIVALVVLTGVSSQSPAWGFFLTLAVALVVIVAILLERRRP